MTLASQENPKRYLCPHMTSETVGIVGLEDPSGKGNRAEQEVQYRQDQSSPVENLSSRTLAGHTSTALASTACTNGAARPEKGVIRIQPAKRKDPKSFAQNLFDTKVIRSFYDDSSFQHCSQSLSNQGTLSSKWTNAYKQTLEHTDEPPTDPRMNSTKTGNGLRDLSTSIESQVVKSQPLETLSHFSCRNVQSLYAMSLALGTQKFKALRADHSAAKSTSTALPDYETVRALKVSPLRSFAHQSIAYVLSQSSTLLNSFRKHALVSNTTDFKDPSAFQDIVESMAELNKLDQTHSSVMHSLLRASTSLFPFPTSPQIEEGQTHSTTSSQKNNLEAQADPTKSHSPSAFGAALQADEAAHVALVIFAALIATIPPCSVYVFQLAMECHGLGRIVPAPEVTDPKTIQSVQRVLDAFDNEDALNLLAGLVKALSARNMATRKIAEKHPNLLMPKRVVNYVLDWVLGGYVAPFAGAKEPQTSGFEEIVWGYISPPFELNARPSIAYIAIIIEWVRYLVIKEWDGGMEVDLSGPAGGALDFLWDLRKSASLSWSVPADC